MNNQLFFHLRIHGIATKLSYVIKQPLNQDELKIQEFFVCKFASTSLLLVLIVSLFDYVMNAVEPVVVKDREACFRFRNNKNTKG